MKKVLVIGAGGQIGTELVLLLEDKFGKEAVLASDIKEECPQALAHSKYISLNLLEKEKLSAIVKEEGITDAYLLAALLSATAEMKSLLASELNMERHIHVLDSATA